MGHLGLSELIFIFVIALLVLGPRRLPEVAQALGKGLVELKRATSGLKDSIEREIQNAANEASAANRPKSEPGTHPDVPKS